MKMLGLAILAALFGGCASVDKDENEITFESNPPGATISMGAQVWGVSPQTKTWTLAPGVSHTQTAPITATWVSGAKATARVPLDAGRREKFVFQRPSGFPGLDADIRWAMHLNNKRLAEDAEFAESLKRASDSVPWPKTTNCTSVVNGRTINTQCN